MAQAAVKARDKEDRARAQREQQDRADPGEHSRERRPGEQAQRPRGDEDPQRRGFPAAVAEHVHAAAHVEERVAHPGDDGQRRRRGGQGERRGDQAAAQRRKARVLVQAVREDAQGQLQHKGAVVIEEEHPQPAGAAAAKEQQRAGKIHKEVRRTVGDQARGTTLQVKFPLSLPSAAH